MRYQRSLFTLAISSVLLTTGIERISFPGLSEQIAHAQTRESRQIKAERLLQQGKQQYEAKQYSAAIQTWETALAIYRELRNLPGQANTLQMIGLAYVEQSQPETALAYLKQALQIEQTLPAYVSGKERSRVAKLLLNMGVISGSQKNYAQAIAYLNQALPILRELEPKSLATKSDEAKLLFNLGLGYGHQMDYATAIAHLEKAIPLYREVRDQAGEAKALDTLGRVYVQLAKYDKAIFYLESAIALYHSLGNQNGEAEALKNLGIVYRFKAQYAKATDAYEQALLLHHQINEPKAKAQTLQELGNLYQNLGQNDRAIAYLKQSLNLMREVNDPLNTAKVLGDLGIVYTKTKQYAEAIAYFEEVLPIFRQKRDRKSEATALMMLGRSYLFLSNFSKASRYYEQSLDIFQELNDAPGKAAILVDLGAFYAISKQYSRARGYYEEALQIYRNEVKNNGNEANTLNSLGMTLAYTGQYAEAEPLLRKAMELRECSRVGLEDDQKVSLFDAQSNVYTNLQRVLVAQKKVGEALEIAERGRARAFVELLTQKKIQAPDASETCTPVQPLNLAKMQQIAQQQNATLVQYSIIRNQYLFIWVIPPQGKLAFRWVDLKPILKTASLENFVRVTRYNDLAVRARSSGIKQPDPPENTDTLQAATLKTLHQLFIAPIAQQLPTDPTQQVIFIPQGALFLVPFAALQNAEGRYLIERHTISTAPSIQVLALASQQRAAEKSGQPNQPLIVGNPMVPAIKLIAGEAPIQLAALPGAEAEAEALSKQFQTPALIGRQATESAIKTQMPQASLIHLAAHGVFDDEQGLASAIALTPTGNDDGLLTATEILEMQLQADLVVLSACDTGRGKITGDGVIGLSRSLISAGAPSVVVSLWAVPDSPTAFLMTEFYQNLEVTGHKAQALRQAMLTTLKRYPKPRDWAAFTLIGEARGALSSGIAN
ncbi:MAG TPA: CHAT domain-containing protein [Leptolyngbyaceae cyanobacterium M33_DOE_097]|uniref:CHAT domain-containing protein n=1 Tax=Oscillatoriales cyanobacterium SpSt-418 TaxID=2282169 RepID=A0A7C3KDL4_9CYAN|nr:CHAT domain-containing protein [Leptolyngbyaceae cyanobacterium M33_DOE_097]